MKKTIKYLSTFSLIIILLFSFPAEVYAASMDNADTAGNWTSSDATNLAVAQETTYKQEGTGSVKLTGTEADNSAFAGDGNDGSITISVTTNINTTDTISERDCTGGGDAVNYSIISMTSSTATLSTTPGSGCLSNGDEILIINLQGTQTANGNVGNYETLEIQSMSGTEITFTTDKANCYGDSTGGSCNTNIGVVAGNQRVMLQRVPNYTDVTIDSGYSFVPSSWNGTKNGVMFFKASGTVLINGTGKIRANGSGYKGGAGGANVYVRSKAGESVFDTGGASGDGGAHNLNNGVAGLFSGGGGGGCNFGLSTCTGVGGAGTSSYPAGGGGGGGGGGRYTTAHGFGAGGGGGGYGAKGNGGAGFNNGTNGTTSASGGGGIAGRVWQVATYGGGGGGGAGNYGAAALPKLFLGSGGAGGGAGRRNNTTVYPGGAGGAGGGIVVIGGTTITVTASAGVTSTGGIGISPTVDRAGCGGSGSGGSIKLLGETVTMEITKVTASGGAAQTTTCNYAGGAAGAGRIAVQYTGSVSGTTSPTADLTHTSSLNTTAAATISSTDLSDVDAVMFWARSDRTGGFMRFQMGESDSSEQTYDITINAANTWEQKSWDVTGITDADIDAVTKLAFKTTNADSAFNFYFDDIKSHKNCASTFGETRHTIYANCSFSGYIDANNQERIIDGVDAGAGTENTAVLEVKTGTLTMNSNETLAVGSLELTGGSIVNIVGGAQILIGMPLWAIDADSDDYPAHTMFYGQSSAPGNGVRLGSLGVNATNTDCDDDDDQVGPGEQITYYRDFDEDTYGDPNTSQQACAQPAGYIIDDTDCYDADPATTNAELAYPGSTTCSGSHRGDSSYDYNCSSSDTKCGTTYDKHCTNTTCHFDYSCGGMAPDKYCNDNQKCFYNAATYSCGATGCIEASWGQTRTACESDGDTCSWGYSNNNSGTMTVTSGAQQCQ